VSLSPRIRTAVVVAVAIAAVAVSLTSNAGARTISPRAPKTVEIKMVTANGMQLFEPKEVTIQVGDTVKWIASSGSHNVAFWADSIPAGSVDLLRKAMGSDTVATLTTTRKPTAGDSIKIVFAGMPKGTYLYYCKPHLMRNMIAKLIVQ
jgi:plastocyanin